MLRYTSILDTEYRDNLERLLFFNPGQNTALAAIVDSLETYGPPSVHTEDNRLRVKVEKLDDVQTLYAMDDEALAGVLVYSRTTLEQLTVIHIAVDHKYSSDGKFAHQMLVLRMLELLRTSARSIKGVRTIRITLSDNQVRVYPV